MGGMRASALLLFSSLALACGAPPGDDCSADTECPADQRCSDGACVPRADGGEPGVDAGPDRDAFVPAVDAGPLECAEDCGDGVCVAGACCEAIRACDGVCCGGAQVCSFGSCVDIGATCAGVEDCGGAAYCELALGEPAARGEVTSRSGRCLPRPPACPAGTEPDPEDPECITECSFAPDSAALDLGLRYAWGSYDGDPAEPNLDDVRNSPIVINLDDDDCDGAITARDIPEIVVLTSPNDNVRPNGAPLGDLVALSVVGDALVEKWRVPAAANAWSYPAAGNFDGQPGNEIVVCTDVGTAVAYGVVDGNLAAIWTSPPLGGNCSMPSLADLDQDGDVEIVTQRGVLDGATGAIELTYDVAPRGQPIVADVDGDADHRPEVITPSQVYRVTAGGLVQIADNGFFGNHALVAQLDGTGNPEIVALRVATRTLTVWRYAPEETDGFVIAAQVADINAPQTVNPCNPGNPSATPPRAPDTGFAGGGGPPTAGDVNGDGVPDIAVAGGIGYAVLNGAELVNPALADPMDVFFWSRETLDCSSAQTGSSVFDFNGDGRAEVLYADEHTFRVYEGATGDVLFETCNTNGTILEQPIVADVDNDGQADIVVVSNARYRACLDQPSMRTSGVRVFSSAAGDFVRTRRVWNQHAYSITNVEEDGSIPARVTPSWALPELNNFRLNRQPGNQFAAADLVVSLAPRCTGGRGVFATVRNLGEAVVAPGATVALYQGSPPAAGPPPAADLIAEVSTNVALYPAQSEVLAFDLADPLGAEVLVNATTDVFAVVTPPSGTIECRPDNGVATLERRCTLR